MRLKRQILQKLPFKIGCYICRWMTVVLPNILRYPLKFTCILYFEYMLVCRTRRMWRGTWWSTCLRTWRSGSVEGESSSLVVPSFARWVAELSGGERSEHNVLITFIQRALPRCWALHPAENSVSDNANTTVFETRRVYLLLTRCPNRVFIESHGGT